jgi:hypothetical protein
MTERERDARWWMDLQGAVRQLGYGSINLEYMRHRMLEGERAGIAEYGAEGWRDMTRDLPKEGADEQRDAMNYARWDALRCNLPEDLQDAQYMDLVAAAAFAAVSAWHFERARERIAESHLSTT